MLENIKTRRSCRSYLDNEVSLDLINEVVECGLLAPSAMNKQDVEFCVVTNKDILKEMAVLVGREFCYQAPCLIIVYGTGETPFDALDGSCALAQMYLAAHELGLGSCWIHQVKDFVDDPKFDAIMDKLALKGKKVVGSLALGYKASEPNPRMMKKICRVHYVK